MTSAAHPPRGAISAGKVACALFCSVAVLGCRASPSVQTVDVAPAASARAPDEHAAPADRTNGGAQGPSSDACERLWSAYHAIVPESPWIDHEGLVARCLRSEREVLDCVRRTKQDLETLFGGGDAGPSAEESAQLLAFGMATRFGVCVTQERVRFAERTGELERLARAVAVDPGGDGPFGTRVVTGTFATLPWRGVHETRRGVAPAPEGEIRVARRRDGRVWIYMLGSLFGRHQNQAGFLYGSAPFVFGDFEEERDTTGRKHERVCLETPRPDGGDLYLLDCFAVTSHLSPQLVAVGAAPD